MGRYVQLWLAFARYGLARELAFRGNFLVKLSVEVLWLGILLVFYRTIFTQTSVVAEWSEAEYLFFVGCYFALNGLIESLFLENCSEFSELVRSGDLDFILLKPIDEQFLVTFRQVDWSTALNVLMGGAIMLVALDRLDWSFDPLRVAAFLVLFVCGAALAYSFLLLLTAQSIWLIRNQSLYELWWLFTSLARYPREIFKAGWATPIGWFFTFVVPMLLVVNIPAETMVKALHWDLVCYTVLATGVLLYASRKFFQRALKSYRSASS